MVVAAVLLRSSPMSFGSLLVMFGSLLMHILRHGVFLLLFWGRLRITSEALESSSLSFILFAISAVRRDGFPLRQCFITPARLRRVVKKYVTHPDEAAS